MTLETYGYDKAHSRETIVFCDAVASPGRPTLAANARASRPAAAATHEGEELPLVGESAGHISELVDV